MDVDGDNSIYAQHEWLMIFELHFKEAYQEQQ
jgi:hypothetical protein